MKTLTTLLIVIAFVFSGIIGFGQTKNYPFVVQKTGKGKQNIIFIPGFASSGDVWKETRAAYESGFTCYTLTMAGFAGIPAQTSPSFKNWEAAIADYIQSEKIVKPVIVGHSMGGGLALALAADYPELASKIVVVDALPCLAALMNPNFKARENNDCAPIVSQMKSMTPDQFEKMQFMTMHQMVSDTSRIREIVGWSIKSDMETFGQMYCDFLNTDLRPVLEKINCPALVLLEPSFVNYKPAIDEQYKGLKTGEFAYATKGLHFIMYDDTAWYNQQLSNFIK
ncbi:alpha/beta fold hydrolase [Dyadobacter subterraneus]|uniref:Alpha/beta hydrolase n=1 Tax=Dyadobacter subterraneus TaxID=2773304 RepID=A0ABR9WLT2_9BACT|nr:alpha/beta hydrolase [Dyadobacter subterraneus]MBE9466469.1 alpha/beta hydrolase [Dyadobacter subterraneus]